MTLLTNTCKTPLGLPSGQVIEPGKTERVQDIDRCRANAVVAAWLRAGLLRVVDEVPVGEIEKAKADLGAGDHEPPPAPEGDEKDQLIAKLEALGHDYNRRHSLTTLRDALAAAQAA